MPDQPAVLEMRHVTKRFPGIVANDDVSFDLRAGEVHALLGENGAGKSTLMNCLYGLYTPDEGEILIHGERVELGSPRASIDKGVGMVHQHFMLIPVMTVAENIVLAVEPRHAGILMDEGAAESRVRELSEQFGLAVDPHAKVQDITVGQQQRVEILKALYRGAALLVLDEPTAVLTPQEAHELFGIVRSLTEQGKSIIFISHKLNEVLEIADRITVLRRGKLIETISSEGATEDTLARLMVGRDVLLRVEKSAATPTEPLLRVEGLSVRDDRGLEKVRNVEFEVRAGEIVAIAGGDGNGQTELIDALTGLMPAESGRVEVDGRDVTHANAHRHFEAGLGHIPEDRQRRGLVLDFSIAENISLHDFRSPPDSRFGWLFPRQLLRRAARLIEEFDVRGGGPRTRAGGLSGGNQQEVILAREIDRDPRVLVAAQPTRGLDVGAIEFVHRRLVAERDEGRAVLLVSLELEEVLSLADRILVMYEGEIVGEFPPTASEEELGIAMTGGGRNRGVAAGARAPCAPPSRIPARAARRHRRQQGSSSATRSRSRRAGCSRRS
jgi:simple sugar transport system ATP-binding protein